MLFNELVLQDVRNFRALHRFSLPSGLSVVVGGTGSGKSTIVELISHVLYPNSTEPGTDAYKNLHGADTCRIALFLQDALGQQYRLVQDLVSGSIGLARLDPASANYLPVSSAINEISQYLGSQLHLPHQDVFSLIFTTSDRSLPTSLPRTATAGLGYEPNKPPASPSRKPELSGKPVSASNAPGIKFQGYQGIDPTEDVLSDSPEEIKKQIESLERDLAIAREADELQFKLDGLQSELFAISQQLKMVKEEEEKVQKQKEALAPFEGLAELPQDFESQVRKFETGQIKLKRDLERLVEEKEKWEKKLQQSVVLPLLKNKVFWTGLGIGLLALGVGILGFYWLEALRWVALLDIVGFGMVALAILSHIDDRAAEDRIRKRLLLAEDRREKLNRQFDLEFSRIRQTMTELEISDPREIVERFNQRNKILETVQIAQKELDDKTRSLNLTEGTKRKQQLETEIGGIESKLIGASGLIMGQREMEKRLISLRERLEQLESPGGRSLDESSSPVDAQAGFPNWSVTENGILSNADPLAKLFRAAEDLLLVSREQLEQAIAGRGSQYVAALTGNVYTGLVFGPHQTLSCVQTGSGLPILFGQLPASEQDLVYLGIKFTILELASGREPMPVVLDDPFGRIPARTHELLGRMLMGLANRTQVILFTSDSNWTRFAGHSIQLGG